MMCTQQQLVFNHVQKLARRQEGGGREEVDFGRKGRLQSLRSDQDESLAIIEKLGRNVVAESLEDRQ